MTKIVLHHHTGLGDHFICNGLVNTLAKTYEEINLVCKRHYSKTIQHLYEDSTNINVLVVDDEFADSVKFASENEMEIVKVGFQHVDPNNFENSFYNQMGIDTDVEYTGFMFPERLDGSLELHKKVVEKLGENYIFVHDECSSKNFNLNIDSDLPRHAAVKEDTDDILDYVDTICNAKEIHVINSGLFNLVFQLYYEGMLKTDKVYFHHARKIEDGGFPIKILPGIIEVDYE
jgi:hypothetical protein